MHLLSASTQPAIDVNASGRTMMRRSDGDSFNVTEHSGRKFLDMFGSSEQGNRLHRHQYVARNGKNSVRAEHHLHRR
jgi:hypothetical protein